MRCECSTLEGRATTFSACACAVKERKATAVSTARRGVSAASSMAAQHLTMAASDSSTAVLYMTVAAVRFSSASWRAKASSSFGRTNARLDITP